MTRFEFKARCGCRRRPERRLPRIPASAAAPPALPAQGWLRDLPEEKRLLELARQVSARRLRTSVARLCEWPTRHTFSPNLAEAAGWIEKRFRGLGYKDIDCLAVVRRVPQLDRLSTFYNIRCRKPGPPGAPRRIVCAHFDSRTKRPFDWTSRAPGANDNGTGVAVLLELARLARGIDLPDTVEFVATSGEEQGLWGSIDYAADLGRSGAEISFMLNLDEVGFPNEGGEVVVEHDTGNRVPTNDRDSVRLASEVAYIATRDLAIPTRRDEINNSDYMPFEARGYVTIGLYESGDYDKFRHTGRDGIERVNFGYVADVARVALVALLRDFHARPAAPKRPRKRT
jgi:hypothetical protein